MTDSATLTARRGSGPARSRWLQHPAAVAAGGFLAIRAIGLVALLRSDQRAGRPLIEVLGLWDGGWFVRIAEAGYAGDLDLSAPMTDQSTGSLAFFPVYPILIRALSGLAGLDPRWAGVLISLTAGAVAAAGVAILARDWAGDRVGLLAGLLWSAAPMGVVAAIVYSEALFTALVVWTFIALRRHSWLIAGTLGALAGLTRPTGIAVGAAVAAYAAWTVVAPKLVRRSGRDLTAGDEDASEQAASEQAASDRAALDRAALHPATRRTTGLALTAGALAVAGTPSFWLWVGQRAGRWDGWFAVQEAFWGSRFDGGASIWRLTQAVVRGETLPGVELMSVSVLILLIVSVALLALAVRGRVWWPLLAYAAISLVMVIGSSGYFSSKLRFLVPIFVLAFPLARWLAARSRSTQVLAVMAAVAATTLSGTWLLLSWPYAI